MPIDASQVRWDAPDPKAVQWDEPPIRKGTGSDTIDAANAVGTGYFRGLTRLAGLPVDTAANVLDLGKAALGSAYIAATGKEPPHALQLGDRANVVGSGDNLIRLLSKSRAGDVMLNPANPDYEGGLAQTAGAGLTAVIAPNTGAQAVHQGVLGVTSALAGKTVADATGNPALAVAASLAPSGVQQATTAATKYAVRGGEAGRQQMEQFVAALRNGGVEKPTLGLASGNRLIGGVENILQSTPGAVGVMSRARDEAIAGLRGKVDEAADLASSNRGALESGVAIRKGIESFKDAYKDKQGQLYDKLDQHIDPSTPTSVANTQSTLGTLNADITGAPNVSAFFKNQKIQALAEAIRKDTSGSPQSVMVYPRPPVAGGGIMNAPVPQEPVQVVVPPGPPRGTLPWEAVKKSRTMVGNEIADNTIASDVPNSKWRPLYGALSQDMSDAANQAGPQATQAFDRASTYTRAGADRLERVAPFAQTVAPEQAFTQAVNATRENVSTLQALKKTLPPDARGSIAGTVIERLGRATNGVQNADGTAWSPETFLTNWNKMTPSARQELFSGFPNSDHVLQNVDNVAKTTSMMRDSSKMWANPSGSGANLMARGMLGAVGIGGGASLAGLVNPAVPLGVAGGMAGTRLLAQALTSPAVVNAVARRNSVSPEALKAQLAALLAPGQLNQKP